MAKYLYDTEDIKQAVYLTIGAASMCWENVERAGVFQDRIAREIGEELIEFLRAKGVDVGDDS